MPQDLPPGWSYAPPPRPDPAPRPYGPPESYRRRAVAALVVAVRLGGRLDEIRVERGTSRGQTVH